MTTFSEVAPSIETTYRVKLYHPQTGCQDDGKSEYRILAALNEARLRVKVETTEGMIFSGENCKKCSARAHVSHAKN